MATARLPHCPGVAIMVWESTGEAAACSTRPTTSGSRSRRRELAHGADAGLTRERHRRHIGPLAWSGRNDAASGFRRLGRTPRGPRQLDRRQLPIRRAGRPRRGLSDSRRPVRHGADHRRERGALSVPGRTPVGGQPAGSNEFTEPVSGRSPAPRFALGRLLSACAPFPYARSYWRSVGLDPQQRASKPGRSDGRSRPVHARGHSRRANHRRTFHPPRALPRQRGGCGPGADHTRASSRLSQAAGRDHGRRHGVGTPAVRRSAALRGSLEHRCRSGKAGVRDGGDYTPGHRCVRGL